MESKKQEWRILTDLIRVLVDHSETNHQYAIFEEQVPPLGGPPPHAHPDEEVFYILEGEFEFLLNDLEQPFRTFAGSVVHVPSNAFHAFKNIGKSAGKMVVVLSPGNLLDYFRVIGEPITDEADRPNMEEIPDFSALNISKAFEFAEQHQIQFVMPDIVKK